MPTRDTIPRRPREPRYLESFVPGIFSCLPVPIIPVAEAVVSTPAPVVAASEAVGVLALLLLMPQIRLLTLPGLVLQVGLLPLPRLVPGNRLLALIFVVTALRVAILRIAELY